MGVRELETIINPQHWRLLIIMMKVARYTEKNYQQLHIFTSNISNQNSVKGSFIVQSVKQVSKLLLKGVLKK